MSREALHESLSAVMDNEADELELRRVLAASGDAELRAAWSRWQVARAAMHKELLEPRMDISAAVAAAIADDDAPVVVPAAQPRSRWSAVSRVAVAASVAVAVLAGVRLYNQSEVAGPQMAAHQPAQEVAQPVLAPQAHSPAVLAGYSDQAAEGSKPAQQAGDVPSWQEKRLADYLRQHAAESAAPTRDGALAR